jgi:hypothetical protein
MAKTFSAPTRNVYGFEGNVDTPGDRDVIVVAIHDYVVLRMVSINKTRLSLMEVGMLSYSLQDNSFDSNVGKNKMEIPIACA